MKRWRLGLLGALVSVLAIYFIVSQMDIEQLSLAIQTARYEFIILCAVILAAGLYTRGMRWVILLNGGLAFWRAFHIMNVAYFVNGILPLRMGEVARAFLATRADPPVPIFKSLSTIIVERLLDLLAVIGLIMMALVAAPLPTELRAAALFLGPLALVGFIFMVGLAKQRKLADRIIRAIAQRLPQRLDITTWANHFLDGLTPLTKPSTLLWSLLLTIISWACSVVAGYVLMFTFYDSANWLTTLLFIAAASLAIAIPAVPGNVGTYELSILLALNATGYGEPASIASLFAITVHGVNLIIYAIFGAWGFIQEGISLQQLSKGVRGIQNHNAG